MTIRYRQLLIATSLALAGLSSGCDQQSASATASVSATGATPAPSASTAKVASAKEVQQRYLKAWDRWKPAYNAIATRAEAPADCPTLSLDTPADEVAIGAEFAALRYALDDKAKLEDRDIRLNDPPFARDRGGAALSASYKWSVRGTHKTVARHLDELEAHRYLLVVDVTDHKSARLVGDARYEGGKVKAKLHVVDTKGTWRVLCARPIEAKSSKKATVLKGAEAAGVRGNLIDNLSLAVKAEAKKLGLTVLRRGPKGPG